jgi:hypothetical protein
LIDLSKVPWQATLKYLHSLFSMATAVFCSPPLNLSLSSQHYARLIDEACASRSVAKLVELTTTDGSASFVQTYIQSETLWLREQQATASSPSSSPSPAASSILHEALCRACRGGTVAEGSPSIGLGVLSAVWKHLVVPMFASSQLKDISSEEKSVLARFLEFVLDLVVQDVLSHNWEKEKEIQLSKFFASYLVAVIKSFPSLAAESTITAQVFHFYGVVAAAVGTSLPDTSGTQLLRTILVRLEAVIHTIGAAPDISSSWKQTALHEFVLNGSLKSIPHESEDDGSPPLAENRELFHGVVASVFITFLKDIPLGARTVDDISWLAYLIALLPSSTHYGDHNPLLVMLRSDNTIAVMQRSVLEVLHKASASVSSSMLFSSDGDISGGAAARDLSFSERWLLTSVRVLTAVASIRSDDTKASHLIAPFMYCTSHPVAAEMVIALWSSAMTTVDPLSHSSSAGATIAASVACAFVAGVCHYAEVKLDEKPSESPGAVDASLIDFLRMCYVSGRCIQRCSQCSPSMAAQLQQLINSRMGQSPIGPVCRWILTSVCEQLQHLHQRPLGEEQPPRKESIDGVRFFGHTHIPMSALNVFSDVCSLLGVHCELTEVTAKDYQSVALQQSLAVEKQLSGVFACGASHNSGVLLLPESTAGIEALISLTKSSARARLSSKKAVVAGLHLLSRAPGAHVLQQLGLGDSVLNQLRSTARLLASVVCPLAALEGGHDVSTLITGLDALKGFAQATQLISMQELALDEKVIESLVLLLQPLEGDAVNMEAVDVVGALPFASSSSSSLGTAGPQPWWRYLSRGSGTLAVGSPRKRPRSPAHPPAAAATTVKKALSYTDKAIAALKECEATLSNVLASRTLDDNVRRLVAKAALDVEECRNNLRALQPIADVIIKQEVEVHEIDDDDD